MIQPVIISAVRTAVGRYMGALRNVEAYDLASRVLEEVIRRVNIHPDLVDEVIMGQSYQNGECQRFRNFSRTSDRCHGGPRAGHAAARDETERGALRFGMHLRRRWSGNCGRI